MNIAFIGLGIMGKPMVHNLIKAGHRLTVHGHGQKNIEQCVKYGAKAAVSAKEATLGNDLVITMLPNSPNVKDAVMGHEGVLEGAKPGAILIDMSSIAPLASLEIAAACAMKGVKMLDAPVSGGEAKAIDATLAIMVGGDRLLFEQVKDEVFLKLGASAVYCGGIGAGNTAKLANQVIVAANIAAVAEAFTLAEKAGVDPHLVLEAVKGGLAGSAVMNAKVPKMLEGNFQPGFKIDLHIKDLANALDTGHSVGAPLPLTANIMEMFQNLRAGGFGQEDHGALVRYYGKLVGRAAKPL